MVFFSGYERRGFHFGVNDEGQCDLFLIGKNRKRIGATRKVRIFTELIVEDSDGKRSLKRLKNDVGYHTEQDAGLDHEEIKYTAMTTGGARVGVHIKYSGNKITMDGKITDRGKWKQGKLYLNFRIYVPAMYGTSYQKDQAKAKARMRRDKVRFVRAKDRKRVSLKSYEMVDLRAPSMAKDGIVKLEVNMDGQARRSFHFSTENEKGVLRFENKERDKPGMLWSGYQVVWERPMGDTTAAPLVIEIK